MMNKSTLSLGLALFLVSEITGAMVCNQSGLKQASAPEVIKCFLENDYLGGRLGGKNSVFNPSFLTAWEGEAGWDMAVLTDSYDFKAIPCPAKSSKTAQCFKVNYKVWGTITSGQEVIDPSATVRMEHMEFLVDFQSKDAAWRVLNPEPFPPHVSISAMSKHLQKLVDDFNSSKKEKKSSWMNKLLKSLERLEKIKP
ncbi:hypothetical protein GW915_04875 [bacterium]|nr:hypothetical protein [bacterium]